jgi:hypothetical protein
MILGDSMRKIVTKFPIPNILLGIILIAFSVYATFLSTLMEDGLMYVAALLIVAYASIRLYKDLTYYHKRDSKLIVGATFFLIIIVAVLLVLEYLSVEVSIGLWLYLTGASYMLILQVRKAYTTIKTFLANLVLITVGTYLIFTNQDFVSVLVYAIFAILTLYGVILLYFGVSHLVKASKEKKKNRPVEVNADKELQAEPKDETPVSNEAMKPEPPKETTTMYTKNELMKKTVDELKAMCKARDITGYSTLNKKDLVEKLWLYEHQEEN